MKYDLHILKTKKSVSVIKKIIQKEIFGNYKTGTKCKEASFGIMIFKYDDFKIVKLEYNWYNYDQISMAIMEHLGKKLKCDYWIEGVVIEFPKAYINRYQYNKEKDTMVCIESIENKDGTALTPDAKQKWGLDAHDIWAKMKDKMDWEILRQCLLAEFPERDFIEKAGFDKRNVYLKQWIEKFGSLKDVGKKIVDLTYFIPDTDISMQKTPLFDRPEGKSIKYDKEKVGNKVVIEQEGGIKK